MNREKKRDDRDYDTTYLSRNGTQCKSLHRDYTAHFFRWAFVRRWVRRTDHVLEIGCGPEKPLSHILTSLPPPPRVKSYTGVDIQPLVPGNSKRLTFIGEFNIIKQWRELKTPLGGYDVIIHLEVIEHMKVNYGKKLLKICRDLLKPGGVMIMSTPCYDGIHHAANHIHEYTIAELRKLVHSANFVVERRFGTFMNVAKITRVSYGDEKIDKAIALVASELGEYYDNDAISCIFAPLFPDHARNNLWICRRP